MFVTLRLNGVKRFQLNNRAENPTTPKNRRLSSAGGVSALLFRTPRD
jgi:hypothetical protein